LSRWSTDPARVPTLVPWPRRRAPSRPWLAWGVSLVFHALLLSLTFGGEGLGLPGLSLPWQARRAEAPDLRVVLVMPAAEVPVPPPPEPVAATAPAPRPPGEAAAAPESPTLVPLAPTPGMAVIAVEKPIETPWAVPAALPASAPVIAALSAASSALTALRREDTGRTALDREARERLDELAQLDRVRRETQLQAQQQTEKLAEAERLQAARLEAARQEAIRKEAARQEAAARAEAARLEAERLEALRQAAATQEAVRLEAERRAAAQQEAARQETARAEAARAEAARQEAARQEALRQEAARAEAARQAAEADRQEGARQEAARLEAARQQAARIAAAKLAAARAEEEQREARLRAIGQQLNEEAAKRDAARQAQDSRPSSWSSLRRGRLFGRTDANAEMVLYAEAWARKIQLNPTFELVREALKQPYTDPLVTVAIRADGTVESVSFYRSSGVPALDEAIRRVIESQANYPAFTPALAREYDVIEIRRTWHFDSAIRLY